METVLMALWVVFVVFFVIGLYIESPTHLSPLSIVVISPRNKKDHSCTARIVVEAEASAIEYDKKDNKKIRFTGKIISQTDCPVCGIANQVGQTAEWSGRHIGWTDEDWMVVQR